MACQRGGTSGKRAAQWQHVAQPPKAAQGLDGRRTASCSSSFDEPLCRRVHGRWVLLPASGSGLGWLVCGAGGQQSTTSCPRSAHLHSGVVESLQAGCAPRQHTAAPQSSPPLPWQTTSRSRLLLGAATSSERSRPPPGLRYKVTPWRRCCTARASERPGACGDPK